MGVGTQSVPADATAAGSPLAGGLSGGSAWRLAPSVALRPEPFGALAYDFHTRQLSFLKTPVLVDVVRSLAEHESIDTALSAAGIADAEQPAYRAALATLADTGLIEERS